MYNPAIGYSQGMSDLVAPILAEVLDESDTFWCFVGLMQNTIFVSSPRDEDMEKQLVRLSDVCGLAAVGHQAAGKPRWALLMDYGGLSPGPMGLGPAPPGGTHAVPRSQDTCCHPHLTLLQSRGSSCGLPAPYMWNPNPGYQGGKGSLSHLALCFIKRVLRCIWVPHRGHNQGSEGWEWEGLLKPP